MRDNNQGPKGKAAGKVAGTKAGTTPGTMAAILAGMTLSGLVGGGASAAWANQTPSAALAASATSLSTPSAAPAFPKMTLALKFVEFARDGRPVLNQAQASRVVDGINTLYAQCGIQVRLEQYEQVDPARYGIHSRISTPDQMDSIRAPFDSSRYLVIIHTGSWDHHPMGPANAWTAMPGQLPAGAVLEAPVASNGGITAHELGHYLGLDHVKDDAELMNPIIYRTSTRISAAECEQMRTTAMASRGGALRREGEAIASEDRTPASVSAPVRAAPASASAAAGTTGNSSI